MISEVASAASGCSDASFRDAKGGVRRVVDSFGFGGVEGDGEGEEVCAEVFVEVWVEADGGAELVVVVEGEGDGCAEFVGDGVGEVEDVDVGRRCEGEDAEVRRGLRECAVDGVVG
ncbi:hypothetical protein AOZ06_28600 [Kibdelosporangium phytohabitans]|uniref:Uncharacterized protein n=1 Tax=Kibdelosporangium phytohabitans TaxID=860235 RepID=A0A0N7F435_9PSEU|nr:hypothetical protein AOZ06_28600 [Kibdelosporangium phytohabitans]